MNIKAIKWTKFVAYVAGGGLSAVFVLGGPHWTAIGMAVVAIAGAVGTLIPSPATAVVDNAVTTTPGGTPTGKTIDSSPP